MKKIIIILSLVFIYFGAFSQMKQKTITISEWLRLNGERIDSIYSISDTLFFVTDSGTFKMGRELGQGGTTIIPQNILELRDDSLFTNYIDTGYMNGNILVLPEGNKKSLIYYVIGSPVQLDSINTNYTGDNLIVYFMGFLGGNITTGTYNISIASTFRAFNEDLHIVRLKRDISGTRWILDEISLSNPEIQYLIDNSIDNFYDTTLGGGLDSLEVQAIIDSSIENYNDTSGVEISEVTFDILKTDTLELGGIKYTEIITDTTYLYNVLDSLKNHAYIDTTITLLDNTTGGNINIGQVGYSYHWNYEISRGANWRTGNLVASGYSTTIIYDKGTYTESASIGVTINSFNISAGQIRINYTTTNTGSNATMVLHLESKL